MRSISYFVFRGSVDDVVYTIPHGVKLAIPHGWYCELIMEIRVFLFNFPCIIDLMLCVKLNFTTDIIRSHSCVGPKPGTHEFPTSCVVVFICVHWFGVRSHCAFCWYWWNCWPSLFKLSFSLSIFLFLFIVFFIDGGNRRNRRKPPTFRKSLTNIMLYTSPWAGVEPTTSVVIGIDCIGNCESNYHTITATTAQRLFLYILCYLI